MKAHQSRLESFTCNKAPELYQCKHCDFRTDVLVFLKKHLKHVHLTNSKSPAQLSFKSYICKNCTFETNSVLLLLKHDTLKCPPKNYDEESDTSAVFSKNSEKILNCRVKEQDTNREQIEGPKSRVTESEINSVQCFPKKNIDGSAVFSKDPKKIANRHSKEQDINRNKIESDKCIVTESGINSVQCLLKHPVLLDQKRLIYERGRPTPDLQINYMVKDARRPFRRLFHNTVYDKYEWMCGCPVTNKLFCFVCLLFKQEVTAWTEHGVNDLKHLAERAKRHEESIDHVNAWVDYELLGKTENEQLKDHLQNKFELDENVEKNRRILQRLIMCIKFCGAFEIAPDNSGIYGGLINFAAELDSVLAKHMKNDRMLKGASKTIQNKLLDVMFEVYRNELIRQIKSANFVALEVDETTDSSNQRQMVIIIRYVYNGEICERFWSCVKLEGHTANQLANVLLTELQYILEIPSDKFKLIAQSYNGSSIMTGRYNGVQAIIRKTLPCAYLVHCYAHDVNSIMEQAAQYHIKLKIFFGNLHSFTSFFSQSANHTAILDEIVKLKLSGADPKGCNLKNRTANTLLHYSESFRESLETIIDAKGAEPKTISEACELLNHLKCPDFLYWLKLFSFITPHLEMLFTQAQSHGLEKDELENEVKRFEEQVIRIRMITAIIEPENQEEPDTKMLSANDIRNAVAQKLFDNILTQIKNRFDFKDYLSAAKLFDSKEFKTNRREFPQEYFDEVVTSYPMINSAKLKTELVAIYERDDMCALSSLLSLLVLITDNNLKNIFSETYKLLDIICTTPVSTNECERCFPTLTRIKTFLRSTVTEDRLNALAVLSTENKFVQSIPDFDNRVMQVFCNGKDKTDFLQNFICKSCTFETQSVLQWLNHEGTCCQNNKHETIVIAAAPSKDSQWLQCDLCVFKTKYKRSLRNHTKIKHVAKHKQRWFKCSKCTFVTRMQNYLALHDLYEHLSRKHRLLFNCKQCTYTGSTKAGLRIHSKGKHRSAKDDIDWFECYYCAYRTTRIQRLTQHARKMHKLRKSSIWLYCNHCSYKTIWRSALKTHTSVVHKTDYCESRFYWFYCDQCPYKSTEKRTLKRHVLKHVPDEAAEWFQCDQCRFKTKYKYGLNAHKKKRHDK